MTESQRRFQQVRPADAGSTRGTGASAAADGHARAGAAQDPLAGDHATIGGRYVIEARIGEGAHAITYRAHDQRLKRTVAIKVLRSHLSTDAELVSRFVREAELAASISHPNVVDVYDVGTDGNVSYIVMRLVPGQDLKHVIQNDGRMPVSRASPLIQQILRGLGAIHAAGIVHRDVKPQNIIITPDGTAQVTDFGVAYAALAEGLTTQGMTVGTASYMAPEQARGEPVTQATDIYAVGVVFYEMLTGRVPFTGENPMTIMMAHLQSRPIPPSQVVPGLRIPPRVEQIILRSMAKDPAQRFPSTSAMAAALAGNPGSGLADEATTVTGAAAVGHAGPFPSDSTVVRPAMAGYGRVAPSRPAAPPWLADQGNGGGAPPPTMAPAPSGGRGRGWIVALVMILSGLLAAGAVAAATQFGPFDRGGNDGNTPAALAAGSTTPTPTVGPDEQPTSAGIAATETSVSPTATVGPTSTTAPPTATMTSAPTATQPAPTATTVPPTETAVPPTATRVPPTPTIISPTVTRVPPTPTVVPPTATTVPPTAIATATVVPPTATIALPPTETPAIVAVNQTRGRGGSGNSGGGDSGNSGGGNGDGTGSEQLLSTFGNGATVMTIAPSDWAGAYNNLDTGMYGQDCAALYAQGSGYESATLSFDLTSVPANAVTLTIAGLDDEFAAGNPFTIAINGQQLQAQGAAPQFPEWNGQASPAFGTLTLQFPGSAFVEGQNTITIVNQAPNGVAPDGEYFGPYLLLGSGTMEIT